jgi:hypothetical protein
MMTYKQQSNNTVQEMLTSAVLVFSFSCVVAAATLATAETNHSHDPA